MDSPTTTAVAVADAGPTNPTPNPLSNVNGPPPFLCKTYDMVDDPATDAVVSWSSTNNSFVVWNPPEFARDLLPKYFKHSNFSSFVRQLNTKICGFLAHLNYYKGFRKVDPDCWEFANEGFLRGQKHLLKSITRRKPAHGHGHQHQQQAHAQSNSVGACVEVGKFGLEEEVERLKRDKNVLMHELVKLRQQQQTTDGQLQTMVQRLQGMEQRQQQMMSFLAKAVQSPGFLSHFVQQQSDSNRRISEANKKRRLKQDGNVESQVSPPRDGQIVKYQPLVNDAHAMIRQLRKLDANFSSNSDNFYIGDSSSTNVVESKSPTNQASGVTLQEVTLASVPPCMSTSSEPNHGPVSEMKQSCVIASSATGSTPEFREISGVVSSEAAPSVVLPQTSASMPDISPIPDIVETNADISRENYMVMDTGDADFMDLMSIGLNGTIPIDIDKLSPDPDIESFLDDATWEQFLDRNVIPMDSNEAEIPSVESLTKENEERPVENGWNKHQNMDELTQQLGLLNSDTQSL